jgi:serine/threonine-protein kinase
VTRPDPGAWRRINDIFHRALDREPGARHAFVRDACRDAPELESEVLSLLDAHGRTGSFLEAPPAIPAEPATDLDAQRLVGQSLGQYRIHAVLGEGGMGVVYRAEDVRLGRPVALKVVAPRFTGDEKRRERLRREARAAAALNHPGIATVYALEEIDGLVFIAGEFVEGETLRDEIGRGPASVARTIETGVAVARALAAAHDRGVVHRDLKPENLIRTPAGDVKILDFGLARLRDVPAPLAQLTDDGSLLGTPAYMSPEQIRGEPVDGRSDLFALGVVLYELASGVHPFAGADPASTIARILEAEPPRLSVPGMAGSGGLQQLGEIDAIVRTCLRKTPPGRYQSAHELAGALQRVQSGHPSSAPMSFDPPADAAAARWWWQFHQAAATVGYALLMIAIWLARGRLGGAPGRLLFIGALTAVIAAVLLRLHLWFTLRSYPSEWSRQHRHARRWIRVADAAFAAALLLGGLGVLDADAGLASVLVGAAVTVAVAAAIIEPATTRAAFGED